MWFHIVVWLIGLSLVSCEPDFNELTDSDQRSVVIRLQCDSLFSNLLCPVDTGYALNAREQLQGGEPILIMAYCYDMAGKLAASTKQVVAWSKDLVVPIEWKHLYRTQTYHCVFFAEMVEQNNSSEYFEAWFSMAVEEWSNLYLFCAERTNNVYKDALYKAETDLIPDNQALDVRLRPYTYNGYIRFINTDGVTSIEGYTPYGKRVFIKDNKIEKRIRHEFQFNPKDSVRIPLTIVNAEDTVRFFIKTVSPLKTDSQYFYLTTSLIPYTVTIDVQDWQNSSYTLYE